MSFDDVARRMKDRRGSTRMERLEAAWTGKPAELPPLPEPVAPAKRTGALVAAYSVLLAGLLTTVAGAVVLVVWWSALSRWEARGLGVVISIGVAMVVQSTRMFEAVANTAPLPDARLHKQPPN